MKKILTIVLVLALTAALASSALASVEPPLATPPTAAAAADGGTVRQVWKEATASEPGMEVEIDAQTGEILGVYYIPATGGSSDFADWQVYVEAYALAGAPNEEEGQTVAALIEAAKTPEEVEAIAQLTVLFENVGLLSYEDWLAAGKPAADVAGMTSEAANQAASGEASGETAPAGDASAEPAAPAAGDASAEPAPAEPAPAGQASGEPVEEAAEEPAEAAAPANSSYDPNGQPWATIEIVFVIVILVVGIALMLSFGKKKS